MNQQNTTKRIRGKPMRRSKAPLDCIYAQNKELLANRGCLLSAGSQFEGNMESDYSIHVDTNFYGNIVSRQAIIIGKDALVKGEFDAPLIVVFGEVIGALIAKRIIIKKGAKVKAEIYSDEPLHYF